MGIAEETMELESATNKWVITGIQFLNPIYTNKRIKTQNKQETEYCCTTPTTPESLISALQCPGAPRKRKAVSRRQLNGVRDYFKPPELESIFICCVKRS
ncbi:hypothetical protein QVD17_21254 [Tagetes erecta]|uniref:Uncharacterized protein n=1 Tax=Tagetes erecta TaxID=13708 RepID=A0AAD8KT71_TARER|nr:hypothetical protein QVD17_21254 [Tagetes erecta]